MKKRLSVLMLVLTPIYITILFIPPPIVAGWFGPKNYDDCILESMKGVKSDFAAKAIYGSCRQKFPQEEVSTPLTNQQIAKLEGKIWENQFGKISGSLYNGNQDITVRFITIRMTDFTTKQYRDYRTAYVSGQGHIPPLTQGEFSFEPNIIPKNLVWNIIAADKK